ncbi:MAG: MOSC domain-containing protein [Phycisphaerales bacterium]|nr:MOSC domain-containing protein [Phycisphaerales bacterium]
MSPKDPPSPERPWLQQIGLHPVKSCRAIHPDAWPVTETGLDMDRAWMLVDPGGRFISQREEPVMATFDTSIHPDHVEVRKAGGTPVRIPRATDPTAPTHTIRLHQADRLGLDMGDDIAAWFTDAMGRPCRLYKAIPDVDPWRNPEPEGDGSTTRFPDLYPILVACSASLGALFPAGDFDMARFRPNLVIDGSPPFAEDQWQRIRVGEVVLELVKPCARCKITTVDQASGEQRGPEPLRTLASSRSWQQKPVFGWNALVRTPGKLQTGDPVEILETRSRPMAIGPNVRE